MLSSHSSSEGSGTGPRGRGCEMQTDCNQDVCCQHEGSESEAPAESGIPSVQIPTARGGGTVGRNNIVTFYILELISPYTHEGVALGRFARGCGEVCGCMTSN